MFKKFNFAKDRINFFLRRKFRNSLIYSKNMRIADLSAINNFTKFKIKKQSYTSIIYKQLLALLFRIRK